jgi:hypothetical protein
MAGEQLIRGVNVNFHNFTYIAPDCEAFKTIFEAVVISDKFRAQYCF